MRIGVLIRRLNQLRWAEGAIRAAHARGHAVMLLLDQRGSSTGPKASERPDHRTIPARFAAWASYQRVGWAEPVDALLIPAPLGIDWASLPRAEVRAALQTSVSDALNFQRANWDVFYGWSTWWRGRVADAAARSAGRLMPIEFVPVGHPLAEHLTWIDRAEVRRALDLPAGPLVLVFPFPFGAHAQSWRLRYGYRWTGDRRVAHALRRYCDRAGLGLVVARRLKAHLPRHWADVADRLIDGEEPGEPTSMRLLSVASLFVHHLSSGVAEAAAASVFSMGIAPAGWTAYEGRGEAFTPVRGSRIGGPPSRRFYDWLYVASTWTPGEFVRAIRSGPEINQVGAFQRDAYVAHFLGPEPFQAGARIIDDLERRLARPVGQVTGDV